MARPCPSVAASCAVAIALDGAGRAAAAPGVSSQAAIQTITASQAQRRARCFMAFPDAGASHRKR